MTVRWDLIACALAYLIVWCVSLTTWDAKTKNVIFVICIFIFLLILFLYTCTKAITLGVSN